MTEVSPGQDGHNSELCFHPLADIFPLMEGVELDALAADIKANGLREKIECYEGKVIDGRNRYRALQRLGIHPTGYPKYFRVLDFRDDDEARAYVISKNIHRRHLTAEQKRELIAKLVKAQPEKSDRQIAKLAKASPTTVGNERSKLEAAGDVSTVDTRTDTKGREQPAKKGWSRERHKRHRAKRHRLQSERDAATKERLRREDYFEETEAEAKRLAAKLVVLDPDLARDFYELLGIGGEVQLMDALRDALDPEGTGRLEVSDDGLDIPECLRRAP
jgi:ParB-like chromosome segregation protein Spo0J